MPTLTGAPMALSQDVFFASLRAEARPGTIGQTPDGRTFRYAKAGLSPLVAGHVLQARAQNTLHGDITCRATPQGSSEIYFTANATTGALVQGEYAYGLAIVDTSPGGGMTYTIRGHDAVLAAANGTLVLDNETVQVALTNVSRLTLVANPYVGVIQHPATAATGICVGACVYPLPGGHYGWIQTGGTGAALIAGTPAVGQPLTSVGATAGALSVHSAELNEVAYGLTTGRTGKYLPVFWVID